MCTTKTPADTGQALPLFLRHALQLDRQQSQPYSGKWLLKLMWYILQPDKQQCYFGFWILDVEICSGACNRDWPPTFVLIACEHKQEQM